MGLEHAGGRMPPLQDYANLIHAGEGGTPSLQNAATPHGVAFCFDKEKRLYYTVSDRNLHIWGVEWL